jgi:hypothetical protein
MAEVELLEELCRTVVLTAVGNDFAARRKGAFHGRSEAILQRLEVIKFSHWGTASRAAMELIVDCFVALSQ